MAIMESIKGVWIPDFVRWNAVDPSVAEAGEIFTMMMSGLRVTFSDTSILVQGQGKQGDKEYLWTLRSEDGQKAVLDVTFRGKAGVYQVEVGDATHLVLRLVEPKQEVMALQRMGS